MKQTGQRRRRIVARAERGRQEVPPLAGNAVRARTSQQPSPEATQSAGASVPNDASLNARTPAVGVESHASGRVQEFWKELVHAVGPNFSGNLVLHCAHGTVMKYEVHQVLRPRGGPVAVEGPLDASTSDSVECTE